MTALACSIREKHAPHDWGIEFESEDHASEAIYHCPGSPSRTHRGTTNGNARGSSYSRRARRAWLLAHYASDVLDFCRCYRCGVLLYNPDDYPEPGAAYAAACGAPSWERDPVPLTVDRIIPGCQGGTYRRNNIRPACGGCNSETGGSTRRKVART